TFYRRGNYVIIALYACFLIFFSRMYGAMKIGQLRRMEVILSQYLSVFISNLIMYVITSLLAFRFVNVVPVIAMTFGDFLITTIWTFLAGYLYGHIFKSWKILLIYGDRPMTDLVYKVEERRDKYAIYDAINVNEGMAVIAEKVKDFEAVIVGDIGAEQRNDVLKFCYGEGIRAYTIPKISDIILMGSDRIHIFDTPFLLTKGYSLTFDQRFAKRALDIFLSIPMIICTSPFMLLTAAVIKLYDRGHIFYCQERCTRGGRRFKIIKFRSMVENAESDGVAKLASANDARITPVGKFIRAARIDELPQLFNILKGDMSFVGPRPERPEIIQDYEKNMPEFNYRIRVKAGLTGFAQIYGKYNTTPHDKLKLDLFYIENYSLWLDIKLILMTIKILFKRESTEGVEEEQITAEKTVKPADIRQVVKKISDRS
ncbi:MAG: sugar transferase, partial [Eubacterium sp.]|nr:sugar transferase [Eubacterium sp.]